MFTSILHSTGCTSPEKTVSGRLRTQHFQNGATVVGNEQPVAAPLPVAVDRKTLAFERVDEDQRNQLFRELVRPGVVGAVGDHHRQPIGVVPGARQVVGRGLGGGIRRVWGVLVMLVERWFFRAERAVDFVGRDMDEAEIIKSALAPVFQRAVEQVPGAVDIGTDERIRIVDGPVHVALGGKVHHRRRTMFGEQALDEGGVADIAMDELVPAGVETHQRIGIAGVGQQIQVDDSRSRLGQDVVDEVGANEAGAACDKNRAAGWLVGWLICSDIRGLGSGIRDQGSGIRNQESEV